MLRRRMRMGVYGSLAILAQGCAEPHPDEILSMELMDGTRIEDFTPTTGTVSVIVFDPANWLECFSGMDAWLNWKRTQEGRTIFVMTHEPTGVELRGLAIAGILPDKILRKRWTSELLPLQILMRAGEHPVIDVRMNRDVAYRRIAELKGHDVPSVGGTAGDS